MDPTQIINDTTLPAIAFAGALDFALQLRDGSTRPARLRLILQSEIGAFLDLMADDEQAALRLCLETTPPLELDHLTDDSLEALLEANIELNFTRALASQKARQARAERTGAGLRELMAGMVSLLARFDADAPPPATPSPSSGE